MSNLTPGHEPGQCQPCRGAAVAVAPPVAALQLSPCKPSGPCDLTCPQPPSVSGKKDVNNTHSNNK